MPADPLAQLQLRSIWQAAARPGEAKLRDAALRKGANINVKQAAQFVKSQSVAEVFAPPQKARGRSRVPSSVLGGKLTSSTIQQHALRKTPTTDWSSIGPIVHRHLPSLHVRGASENKRRGGSIGSLPGHLEEGTGQNTQDKSRATGSPEDILTDAGAEFKGPFF